MRYSDLILKKDKLSYIKYYRTTPSYIGRDNWEDVIILTFKESLSSGIGSSIVFKAVGHSRTTPGAYAKNFIFSPERYHEISKSKALEWMGENIARIVKKSIVNRQFKTVLF